MDSARIGLMQNNGGENSRLLSMKDPSGMEQRTQYELRLCHQTRWTAGACTTRELGRQRTGGMLQERKRTGAGDRLEKFYYPYGAERGRKNVLEGEKNKRPFLEIEQSGKAKKLKTVSLWREVMHIE